MRRVLLFALVGIAVGIGLGLLIGWRLWPVQYTNTAPAQLRQDYYNDYLLMVATAYQTEGSLEAALDRLALLDPDDPAHPVVALAEQLIAEGGRPGDIYALVLLAREMDAVTPPMRPYLEGGE